MTRFLAPLLLVLALGGCVTGGGGDREVFLPGPAIFISPSGEPFRPVPSAPEPLRAWFAGADANHDGAIDLAEFRADALRVFRMVDENGNGEIRGAEIDRYERDIAPELLPAIARAGPAGPAGPPPSDGVTPSDDGIIRLPGRRGGEGPEVRAERPGRRAVELLLPDAQPISSADYDQSRGVTEAEFLRRTDERFRELDPQGRGRLTIADLHPRRPPPMGTRERRTIDIAPF